MTLTFVALEIGYVCDIGSGDDILVPVTVELEIPADESTEDTGAAQKMNVELVAPCLLPPLRWIKSIRVNSPRYWPLRLVGLTSVCPHCSLGSTNVHLVVAFTPGVV